MSHDTGMQMETEDGKGFLLQSMKSQRCQVLIIKNAVKERDLDVFRCPALALFIMFLEEYIE